MATKAFSCQRVSKGFYSLNSFYRISKNEGSALGQQHSPSGRKTAHSSHTCLWTFHHVSQSLQRTTYRKYIDMRQNLLILCNAWCKWTKISDRNIRRTHLLIQSSTLFSHWTTRCPWEAPQQYLSALTVSPPVIPVVFRDIMPPAIKVEHKHWG